MKSDYEDAVHRFLAWLAIACLIASVHAGPVAILVWLATAFVMTGSRFPQPPNGPRRRHRRRRRR
ncbi:hypothetical protein ACYFX5_11815 [Bremerella sp. T1]|uniref:hypothetical protein n=1 Tax=Bremerella sp. TYQ1 TaxID=3119568 RepID=UPI001CCBEEB5|nr:hypothetical protein [Bremerella volcania]UBM33759.1 hypothetical protein LA756_13760 [Bremerella volcania]